MQHPRSSGAGRFFLPAITIVITIMIICGALARFRSVSADTESEQTHQEFLDAVQKINMEFSHEWDELLPMARTPEERKALREDWQWRYRKAVRAVYAKYSKPLPRHLQGD